MNLHYFSVKTFMLNCDIDYIFLFPMTQLNECNDLKHTEIYIYNNFFFLFLGFHERSFET